LSGIGRRKLTVDLLLLVILVFNSSEVDGGLVREEDTVGFLLSDPAPHWSAKQAEMKIAHKVLVTGEEDSVEHGFVKEEVTHPLLMSWNPTDGPRY